LENVYVRLLVYVLSIIFGMIPAAWAGWISYDEASQMLQISVPGMAAAVVAGIGLTGAVFARWGVK
jgi:hypothetical protein